MDNNRTEDSVIKNALEILADWYKTEARQLPWRESSDPYSIWISEIMLQQTRIAAVLDYYTRFKKALPNLNMLAEVDEDELLKLWQGLGYYNRARNLKKTAQILMNQYNGKFPADYDEIRKLPGIGDYTAGSIASIAFGIAVPAVDGNVLRVLTRLLNDSSDIAAEHTKKEFRNRLLPLIPLEEPGNVNQAIMELGETICLPNGTPNCTSCPLGDICLAHRYNTTDRIPVKTPPKQRKIEERSVYLLFCGERVALRKRKEKGLLAKLWEYPNYSEKEAQSLASDGLSQLIKADCCAQGVHVFSHIEWNMKAYSFEYKGKLPDGWVLSSLEELRQVYAIPNAFQFVKDYVETRLENNMAGE